MADNYGSVLQIRALQRTFGRVPKVYPSLANGVTLTAATSAWSLGSMTEVVPADTITEKFRIDYLSFAAFSAAVTHEVVLYKGETGSEVEIGRVRVHPGAASGAPICVPFFARLIDANEKVSAQIATGTGVANTVVLSISYHEEAE